MESIKTYKDLQEIPDLEFEGYVWKSDTRSPKVLRKEKFDFNIISDNPFIQEALLFCEDEEKSIMIRHTGNYQITEFDLKNLPDSAELNSKTYFSHRIEGIKKLNFKQLWLPEPDENCAKNEDDPNDKGMEVLTLKAHIFTGFTH